MTAVAIALLGVIAVAIGSGSASARGGNHGCDTGAGTMRSDHFWPDGDVVIAGFYTQPPSFPDPAQETITAENPGHGTSMNGLSCGASPGTWVLFTSALGPGDDRVRLDAVGLQNKYPVPPGPLPRRIEAELSGGNGADNLRGHVGVDRMRGGVGGDVLRTFEGQDVAKGGGGGDVIRAAGGGRDLVRCGPGRDKAVVDRGDDVAGCERVVVR